MELKTVAGPGLPGLHPQAITVRAKASEALSKGDVCMFDFAFVAATDNEPGEAASPYYLVRDPDGNGTAPLIHQTLGIFGVATEDIAAGGEGVILMSGPCDFITVANLVASGSRLVPSTTGTGSTAATGLLKHKVIAITTQSNTSGSAAGVTALFDGIHGFGMDVSGLTAP